MTRQAVIVSTARTPIGRAKKGGLVSARPDDLAALVVTAALAKVPGLDPSELEDLIVGCAQPAGEAGYNLARVVALLAGVPAAAGTTVNRYCASSLQALRMATHAIMAGEGDVFVAAGVETVSRFEKGKSDGLPDTHNPKFADAEARTAERAKAGAAAWTPRSQGGAGLSDIYVSMGQTAENVASREGVTRRDMDELALMSHERALSAKDHHAKDITPVTLGDGTVVSRDEGPRASTLEKLSTLEPVFRADGTVTAGNACPLNDGAAALVVMSAERARSLGIAPLARVVATAVSAIDPEIMGLGPIEASRRALARAKMTIDDIDLVEINEAFAAQVIGCLRAWNDPAYCKEQLGLDAPLGQLDQAKLNVDGGAIALGHPVGASGARIVLHLLNVLKRTGGKRGIAAICIGGGQGGAMLVERQ